MKAPYDIICVQDPPKRLAFCRGLYHVWYNAGRELTEEDDTWDDAPMETRVAFLVNQSLRAVDWRVTPCTGHNSRLIATLRLTTGIGDISVHNVYNRYQAMDINQFIDTCTGEGAHIIFGDFNEHHPAWTNDLTSTPGPAARELWSRLQANKMKLLTTPGVTTYTRSADPEGPSSTIDLVFGSPAIASREPLWQIADVPGFETDHRVSQTTLSLEPIREIWSRPNWKRANKQRVRAAAKYHLSLLDHTSALDTPAKIQKYSLDLAHSLKAVITDALPPPKPRKAHNDCKRQPTFQTALDKARMCLGFSPTSSTSRPGDDPVRTQNLLKTAERIHAKDSRTSWREYTSTRSQSSSGIYSLSRLAHNLCIPVKVPQLERMIVNDKEYETTSEISELIKQEWWSNFHGPDPSPIPEPRLDTPREQHPCPQVLIKGEVGRLIGKLKLGKAAGLDTLPSDLFKITKKIITPMLERLYSACIEQSYMPHQFKEARTLVVRKADKESYTIPSSFRPIALLSVMGKMLESLIAHRLRDLNFQHGLLPFAQYGVAGKCTTKALRMMLDPVYSAWTRGLRATLMRLDIKGAYDGVNRKQLLDILMAMGIPTWIIKFVCSFFAISSLHSSTRWLTA